MAKLEMRDWAVKGAELRLLEISEEAKAIFAAFPELRGRGRGFDAAGAAAGGRRGRPAKSEAAAEGAVRRRRRRSTMSAEGRKRISDAQKARWARQKAAKGAAGAKGNAAKGK